MKASIQVLSNILLGLMLSVSSNAFAQTPSAAPSVAEELKFLREENVSIAARNEQPISQAPSNVYVITDEDIRHSGATDIPTVLRRIPGMEVMQMTGAEYNVSVRGDNQQNANKLLVLIDGRSVYFDLQGGYFWKAIPITLPEIKRIEVLKGPASALYGFNAFDGVVNIITKSPEEMRGTTLQFGGGEFGTITSAAIQAGKHGNVGYRLSVGRDQNQQWRNRDALAFRDHKFNAQTEYYLSDSKITISGGIVDVNRFDGPVIETTTASTPFTDKYARAEYARSNFFIRAFWRELRFNSDNITNPLLASFGPGGTSNIRIHDRAGSSIRSAIGNTYDIEAQHTVQLGASDRLSYGANYRHNTLSDNFTDRFSREDRLGLYVQNEWRPVTPLTVVLGARYDLDTFINPTFSPRAAILYTPLENHTFRAAVSVAYRPPTLNETHFDIRSTPTIFGTPCPPGIPGQCPIPIRGEILSNVVD
ncbi:TonB-dependent receptor plug domain-containing protein [Candidatus Nitrospira bockiana]